MATLNIDWELSDLFAIEITEDTTFTFVTPMVMGDFVILFLKVTNTTGTSKNLTWPSNVYWPTNSSAKNSVGAGKTDIFQILLHYDTPSDVYTFHGNIYGNSYILP